MSVRVVVPDPRVLDPKELTVAEIAAALDALPDRAVVTSEAGGKFEVFLKAEMVSCAAFRWYSAGSLVGQTSELLARYAAPLVVIR